MAQVNQLLLDIYQFNNTPVPAGTSVKVGVPSVGIITRETLVTVPKGVANSTFQLVGGGTTYYSPLTQTELQTLANA